MEKIPSEPTILKSSVVYEKLLNYLTTSHKPNANQITQKLFWSEAFFEDIASSFFIKIGNRNIFSRIAHQICIHSHINSYCACNPEKNYECACSIASDKSFMLTFISYENIMQKSFNYISMSAYLHNNLLNVSWDESWYFVKNFVENLTLDYNKKVTKDDIIYKLQYIPLLKNNSNFVESIQYNVDLRYNHMNRG